MSRVELLDDPKKFEALKTHLKTTSSFAQQKKEAYSAIYNGLKDELGLSQKQQIAWVGEHYPRIIEYIKANYTNGNTLRNKLELVATTLLAIDKTRFKEIVRPMFNDTLVIQKKEDAKRDESLLTADELKNYVPYPNLMKERSRLEAEWFKNPNDLKLNIYHLLLAVNTLIPPLRRNWGTMNVWPPRLVDGKVRKVETSEPPPLDGLNYLWEQKPGEWVVCIGHDKIEAARKEKGLPRQEIRLSDDISAVTQGKVLNILITMSLMHAPRNFVLVGVKTKNEPMGNSSYDKALATLFAPRKPTQNLLRKAYVNYWWGMGLNAGQIKEIAYRMRHSPGVALSSYLKTNAPKSLSEEMGTPPTIVAVPEVVIPILPVEVKTIPVLPTIEIKQAPMAVPKKNFNYVEYSKEYRKAHAADINRKQAEKYAADKEKILAMQMVGKLNRLQTTRPTTKSIEKYGLAQNPHTGKWSSGLISREEEENA